LKAGIISAGLNLRLRSINKPKGLLKLGGQETMLSKKIFDLQKLNFREVYIVIRKDAHILEKYLRELDTKINIILVRHDSPSPLDSTLILGECLQADQGILTFNVDSVYNFSDLENFTQLAMETDYLKQKEMVMWASSYIPVINDDPAFMSLDSEDRVISYGKSIEETPRVFGQIRYCSARILHLREILHSEKILKMGSYIKYLGDNQYGVYAFKTNHPTYDIDTPTDVKNIEEILKNEDIF